MASQFSTRVEPRTDSELATAALRFARRVHLGQHRKQTGRAVRRASDRGRPPALEARYDGPMLAAALPARCRREDRRGAGRRSASGSAPRWPAWSTAHARTRASPATGRASARSRDGCSRSGARRGGDLRRRPGREHARLAHGCTRGPRRLSASGSAPPSRSACSSGPRTSRSCTSSAPTSRSSPRSRIELSVLKPRPSRRRSCSSWSASRARRAQRQRVPRGPGRPGRAAAVKIGRPGALEEDVADQQDRPRE